MTVIKRESVCFKIRGPDMVRLMRDLVLEGRWRFAMNTLVDNMLPHFTIEMAIDVLCGAKTLTGDSSKGMDLVDDDNSQKYRETLAWMYFGTWLDSKHNRYFRPYGRIFGWCELDLGGPAGSMVNRYHSRPNYSYETIGRRSENSVVWRSLYYLHDGRNDRVAVLDLPKGKLENDWKQQHIAFEEVTDPPIWIRPHSEPQKALDEWLQYHKLTQLGSHQFKDDIEHLARQREEFREQRRFEKAKEEYAEKYAKLADTGIDYDAEKAKGCMKLDMRIRAEMGESVSPKLYGLDYNGWLNRSGKLYECRYGNHDACAYKHSNEANAVKALEAKGWARLTKGEWSWTKKLTERQSKAIAAWCTDRGKKLPKGMRDRDRMRD